MRRLIFVLPVLLVTAASIRMAETPSRSVRVGTNSPLPAEAAHYLELSVSPAILTPGEMVTLHITYHNIGMPFTDILVAPSESLAFEPELSMPCKYYEHVNECTAIPLRAQATGVVTINASASGEIYDEGCHCWVFTVVFDNSPAVLHIVDQTWRVFLPVVGR